MSKKARVVILTKEPVGEERVHAILKLSKSEAVSIVGVFIEDAMHLPLDKFIAVTLKRIYKGHIYLPEFLRNIISFLSSSGNSKFDPVIQIKKQNIYVIRVKNVQESIVLKKIISLKPDYGLVIGHRILPSKVFDIPKKAMLNVHYGILPGYAGSHTTFWRMTEGHKDVGLTIHKISKKVDSGDILYIKTIPVRKMRSQEAEDNIRKLIPQAVVDAFEGVISGKLKYKTQKKQDYRYWRPPTFLERIKYRKYL